MSNQPKHTITLKNGDRTTRSALLRRVFLDNRNLTQGQAVDEVERRFGANVTIPLACQIQMECKRLGWNLRNKEVYEEKDQINQTIAQDYKDGAIRPVGEIVNLCGAILDNDKVATGIYSLKSAVKDLGIRGVRAVLDLMETK